MKTDRQKQNKPDASGTVNTIGSILGNGKLEQLKKAINEKGGK